LAPRIPPSRNSYALTSSKLTTKHDNASRRRPSSENVALSSQIENHCVVVVVVPAQVIDDDTRDECVESDRPRMLTVEASFSPLFAMRRFTFVTTSRLPRLQTTSAT
jgi:hypothetical protein